MKKGDDFISIHDLSTEEVWQLLDLAADLKQKQKAGIPHPYLQGKTLGMIFEKPLPVPVFPLKPAFTNWAVRDFSYPVAIYKSAVASPSKIQPAFSLAMWMAS